MDQLITPVGRLVQGSLFTPNTTDMDGRPLVDKQGNPRVNFFIAISVEKANPEIGPLIQQMQADATQQWPSGEAQRADFSWKIVDGDHFADKEGFVGCWVLKFSSSFAPKVYERGGTTLITNPDQIKRGHYIRVAGNYKSNGSTTRPGMYLNLSMAEFIGYGEEIQSGPTGDVFAQAQVAHTPSGMTAAPIAPQASALPMQQAPQQAPMQQAPQQAPMQQAPQQAPMQQAPQQAPMQQAPEQAPMQQAPEQAPMQQAPDFGFLNAPKQ